MKVSAERRSTAEKIIDDRFPVSLSTPDSNAPPVKLHAKEICSGLTCTPHFFTEWFVYEMILISSTFLNDRNHRRNVQTKDKTLTHGLFWTSRCVFNPSRQVMHVFYIKSLTGLWKHGVMQKVCPPQTAIFSLSPQPLCCSKNNFKLLLSLFIPTPSPRPRVTNFWYGPQSTFACLFMRYFQ